MTTESFSPQPSSGDDPEHISRLRSLVEQIMADGKISPAEAEQIRAALIADGRITLDEVDVIRAVMRDKLGGKPLEFE